MIMALRFRITLTPTQRGELHAHLRRRSLPASVAVRMRIVLMLDEGASYNDIKEKLDTTAPTISLWKRRYCEEGVMGLATFHPGQPPQKLTPQLRAKILSKTQQKPPDGSTHWSLRKMAAVIGVGKDLVRQVWREAELKPHRLDRYMASDDPQFEQKAAQIIGLYLNPPQHAAVFCVDEKSAIQALDRLDRRLPLSPGRAERHGFEYYRHGTLSLYAALNPQTGEVIGQTAPRHTSQEFVTFLGEVVASQPARGPYHSRQPERAQNTFGPSVPGGTSQRATPLHADLFFVVEPGRDLVFQTATRGDRPRHLYFGHGPPSQTPPLHPPVRQICQTLPLEIL